MKKINHKTKDLIATENDSCPIGILKTTKTLINYLNYLNSLSFIT